MRHYSKVFLKMPDSDSDPPYAVLEIDCDVCGEETLKIHVQHLGTVLRVIDNVLDSLMEDGTAEPMTGVVPDDPAAVRRAREYLNQVFPGWKADRLRRRARE